MTDTLEPDTPRRTGYRIHPDAVWDRARDDYLAGDSAPVVCARHDLGLSAFRARAAARGWRRADRPIDVEDEVIIHGDLNEADFLDMTELVLIRLRRSIVSGRPAEAASWLRVFQRLDAQAGADAEMARREEKYQQACIDADVYDQTGSGDAPASAVRS